MILTSQGFCNLNERSSAWQILNSPEGDDFLQYPVETAED